MKSFACLLLFAVLPGCHRLLPMQQDARDQALADRSPLDGPSIDRDLGAPDRVSCAGSGPCRPVGAGNGKVAAGMFHGCAVDGCGALWCWGWNSSGQLGLGDNVLRSTPARVGTDTDWQSVSAGEASTCAIKTDGSLWCWGAGWAGQLGIGSPGPDSDRKVPTRVNTMTWREVSVGRFHACAIDRDETLWCWGQNTGGEVGADLPDFNVLSPRPVFGGGTWQAVSTGSHSCGVKKTDRSLHCWGPNWMCGDLACTTKIQGILGVGSTAGSEPKPKRLGVAGDWQSVSVGKHHACAIADGGKLWCWGADDSGQAGGASKSGILTAPREVTVLSDVAQVAAGWFHTCARRGASRDIWCFGRNEQHAVGPTTRFSVLAPVQVIASAGILHADFITAGYYSCAVDSGKLYCWGNNLYTVIKYYADSGVAHPDGPASSQKLRGILGSGDQANETIPQPTELCLALP